MVQALVSAKTQSVKDIKRRSFIKRRKKLIIKLFLIIVVLVLMALILNKLFIEYRYSFTDKNTNIKYVSEDFHLKEGFEIFSQDQNFLLVYNHVSDDVTYLSSVVDSISYTQSMLFAKNKNVILVISTLDSQRNLVECQTNFGDISNNMTIDAEECFALINQDNSVLFIDYPFPELDKSLVTLNLSQKLLYIKPNKKEDVLPALRGSINQMFKDFSIIEKNILDVQDKFYDLNYLN